MMEEERARILRMVADGAVSPEEAADLLEAIQPARPEAAEVSTSFGPPIPPWASPHAESGYGRRPRHLVIYVKDGGESRVNLRIPLGLTRAAGKFIPRQAQGFLNKYDINLQEFLESAGNVDSGTVLEIKDGESRVLIAVE
jgi:hypothetical protein